MIQSFSNRLAQDLFDDRDSKATRRFDAKLRRVARRKLQLLHAAVLLKDLRIPPANRLERLKGDLEGLHSIRINDQWRVVFRWQNGHAYDVSVEDYHR